MERLNEAAISHILLLLKNYTHAILSEIGSEYNLHQDALYKSIGAHKMSYARLIEDTVNKTSADMKTTEVYDLTPVWDKFLGGQDCQASPTLCSWYTKRGEPCHKERKLGSEYCSVHAEYLYIQRRELMSIREDKEKVNLTRKGYRSTPSTHS